MCQATKLSEMAETSGSGLVVSVPWNLLARRRPDLELVNPIETIEGGYRQQSVDYKTFTDLFT